MNNNIKEGDLYRILTVAGRQFALYYGYYDDIERHSKYGEPIPIYPCFSEDPQYTSEGLPFATEMQSACEHYEGKRGEEVCRGCKHYRRGDEFLGICVCEKRTLKEIHKTTNTEETQ